VQTVGVDLAAEPKKTAVAVIEWHDKQAVVQLLALDQSDGEIVDLVLAADKAGIDCPLGWPEPFVEFVTAHRDGRAVGPSDLAGRRDLAYRTTDLVLKADAGVLPLSVAADLIGHTAMRAAGLLAQLASLGQPVDRAGTGVVVEVYPAAALRVWQLYRPRYKGTGSRPIRDALIDELLAALPWLQIDDVGVDLCRRSDDALDAVICALIARAAALGHVNGAPAEHAALAATEGWIAVPTCGLADLIR
jgi:predicted nuclease with RNAse H fold